MSLRFLVVGETQQERLRDVIPVLRRDQAPTQVMHFTAERIKRQRALDFAPTDPAATLIAYPNGPPEHFQRFLVSFVSCGFLLKSRDVCRFPQTLARPGGERRETIKKRHYAAFSRFDPTMTPNSPTAHASMAAK